ncbi:MAG: hypothetical protein Fues2KO_36650 [Fuerstiella sp.]
MSRTAKCASAALTIAILFAAIHQGSGFASDASGPAKLVTVAYRISDLPIYRQDENGRYVADSSLVLELARTSIGRAKGFRVRPHRNDTMIVRATNMAHEKLANTVEQLRHWNTDARIEADAERAPIEALRK